jgi:two-component system cell cycle response regulator
MTAGSQALEALIVTDDAATRSLLKKQLATPGYRLHLARNGREALEAVLKNPPQLLICDWDLPDLDGAALCRALRKTRVGRGMYVLLLTAERDNLYEAFEAGADDCLEKPVATRALSARLRAGERRGQLQREREGDIEEMRRFAAELAVTNMRLRECALTDPTTGLPNRRYALRLLARQWSASVRSGRPLSCMAIQCDDLRRIEQMGGREAGEALLKGLARTLRNLTRGEEELCRWSGEVFLLICPDSDSAQASRGAERLREAIGRVPVRLAGQIHKISVSVGIATRFESTACPEDLIQAALEALASLAGPDRIGGAPRTAVPTEQSS